MKCARPECEYETGFDERKPFQYGEQEPCRYPFCHHICQACSVRGMRRRRLPRFDLDVLTCPAGHRFIVHPGQRLRGEIRKGVQMCDACWMGWGPDGERWFGQRWRQWEDFEPYAHADHHVLGLGREGCSKLWFRHKTCGQIVPRWQRGLDHRTGESAPPYCLVCDNKNYWTPARSRKIEADARDLLYLIEFRGRGQRFVKIGRTLAAQHRLSAHLRLPGARLLRVVEGPHDRIADAEKLIKAACVEYRVDTHGYVGEFGTTETFRPGALTVIGDLKKWTGRRGVYDRTRDYAATSL
jgi:hypothetical protein